MLIRHLEGRRVLGPALTAVVQARRRDVRMAKPFLNLGNVGFVFERVGGGGRAQTVHAESLYVDLRPLCIGEHAFVDPVSRD